MPLYDFRCNECGNIKEIRIPYDSTNVEITCDSCGVAMTRLVSASNFCLKGDGWAKDGYK